MGDFERYGYQIIEQLSHNYLGGRITYKAREIQTQDYVVIKQFRFATTHHWDGYKAVEREIDVLKGLNHPGIPRYLSSFDSGDGICLVQEYKNAQSLSVPRSFTPKEVKEIAIQLLEILIYLQNRIPPILHRDIKPENVLFDDDLKVYLVDFGFAKIGNQEVTALSSMTAGTLGFMPPEQRKNKPLKEAADLYGLGATLICLLTNTRSVDIGNLIDDDSDRINFRSYVPKLSLRFVDWLEKLVQPNLKNRFFNAQGALNTLQPLDLIRVPEAKLSQPILEFHASRVGEKLTQTIIVTNVIPDTMLEGEWTVLPHPSDPPHTPDSHAWISFSNRRFKGNQVECRVTIDTSKLMTDKLYQREVRLNSNARQETQILKIIVQAAPLPIDRKYPPYLIIASFLPAFAAFGGAIVMSGTIGAIGSVIGGAILGAILGAIWGGMIWFMDVKARQTNYSEPANTIMGFVAIVILQLILAVLAVAFASDFTSGITALITFIIMWGIIGNAISP